MKTKDIVQLSFTEIQLKIKEVRDELLNLKLKKTTGQVEKPHLIRQKRRLIAVLETVLNAKLKDQAVQV